MRFIHLADVHLDTLFASRSAALRSRLREASREAFRRVTAAAIDRRVDAILIAGDLFDGERLSFETERFLLEELRRLGEAGIQVIYATGNHDPSQGASRAGALAWPENVTVVGGGEPERVTLHRDGSPVGTVTAAGHDTSAVSEDLSRNFPPPEGALPSVAMLHTQVTGARAAGEHARYAPSELGRLQASGYDYWALGHVHLRQALCDTPAIHYPGNLQGRNPRERGDKGALLVDLSERGAPRVDFLGFAPVRWETLAVGGLEEASRFHLLQRRISAEWERARAEEPGAPGVEWLVRIELLGPCPLWRELSRPEDRATLEEQLADTLGLREAEVRAGAVHAVHSVEEHVERQDVVGESLRLLRRARQAAEAEVVDDGEPGPRTPEGGGVDAASLLGLSEEDLGGFDSLRHGTLEAYLAKLLDGQEGELLARLLQPGSGSDR